MLWSLSRPGLMVSWHQGGGVLTVYKPRPTSSEWLLADARPDGMLLRARPQALTPPIPVNRISLLIFPLDSKWNYAFIKAAVTEIPIAYIYVPTVCHIASSLKRDSSLSFEINFWIYYCKADDITKKKKYVQQNQTHCRFLWNTQTWILVGLKYNLLYNSLEYVQSAVFWQPVAVQSSCPIMPVLT